MRSRLLAQLNTQPHVSPSWSYTTTDTFQLTLPISGSSKTFVLPSLKQPSILLHLQYDNTSFLCPSPRIDEFTGKPVDPFHLPSRLAHVTAVFKRLFEPFCEIQILLNQEWVGRLMPVASAVRGERRREISKGYDLLQLYPPQLTNLIVDVLNHCLLKNFSSINEVWQIMLPHPLSGTSCHTF